MGNTAILTLEAGSVQRLLLNHVVLLRDFLIGYVSVKGGEARIDEVIEAIRRAAAHGILVPGSKRDLYAEIEYLTAIGLLERNDGTIRLRTEKMGKLLKKKVEKLSQLLASVA